MSSIEQYGKFDKEEGCFELTSEPPRKWRNIHYNKVQINGDEIYAEVSNIGDGPTRMRDKDGVTCMLVSYDSKYLYVRDDESGTVFCPWGAPAPQEVENKVCRYYPAKTEIEGTCEGIKATHRIFCPRDWPVEAWTCFIENTTDKPRKLSVFGYAMFQLSGCDKEGKGVGKDNFSEVFPEINGVLVTNRNTFCPNDRFKGYMITLNDYFGATGYRDNVFRSEFSPGTPKILWGWDADNEPGFGPDCAGLVQVKLEVPANGKARADFIIGQASSIDDPKKILKEITPEILDEQCELQMKVEKEHADKFLVDTGNENTDALINMFVKKQTYSYVIDKSGFRDNLQNDLTVSMYDYQTAEENILRALASQYPTGSCPHGFRPLNRLQYADKPAWIFLTVPALIKESGNMGLLDEKVPYLESDEKGTVWDHMLRAMRFLASDTGKNGLCDQHHADWNDGLEATAESGDRESVMVTQQFCYGLLEMEELAKRKGDDSVVEEARKLYDDFKDRLNDVAWDGKWYVRTVCGDGYKIGSHTNKEGKIFQNTQSWAILSRTAPEDRAKMCMESLDEMIETDIGYRIVAPGFSEYDPRVGRMSNSYPGHVENGGCYNHAAGFKGVADCVLRRPEKAWDTFVRVAPDSPENPVSRSEIEPFSFTNFYSQVPVIYGRSGYPWRTGTASWFTVLLVEWILGARRNYDGLMIDPCLTKRIPEAHIRRTFRGAVYEIDIDNTAGKCTGVSSITVDGEKIEGNILPLFDGGVHDVKVVI